MPRARKPPPLALTIAGSDSGGGAGIQADLRSFAALAVHGLSAITAITAQNTRGVSAIQMASPAVLQAQLDAVFDDFTIAAVKTGMLGTPVSVRTVARCIAARKPRWVVVDPVLIATTGAALARGGVVDTIRRLLVPLAHLLTPNVPEAEQLLDRRIADRAGLLDAAHALRGLGARAVLLKGGHLPGRRVHDVLVDSDGSVHWFSHSRVGIEGHGTGCSLAAAITALLARGSSLDEAVAGAIEFVHRALLLAYRPGRGTLAVLDHMGARLG